MRCTMTIANGDGTVIAVDEASNFVRINWQSDLDGKDNHCRAVEALYKKQGWVFNRGPFGVHPGQVYLGVHKGISVALTVDFYSVMYADASTEAP